MRAAEEAFSSAQPESAGSESQTRASGALVLKITPMGAFASGALVVSALALAVAVGRQYPIKDTESIPTQPRASVESLEDVRNSSPVRYETLQVDRGTAK